MRGKLDITYHEGSRELPVCIFVHALGMNKELWVDPPRARMLGGLFPITVMIRDYDVSRTLYHDLIEKEFPVIAWTQRRPVGPIAEAIQEFHEVTEQAMSLSERGIILLGISRGGVIARAVSCETEHLPLPQKGLITICSPHKGSHMARWASYLSPVTSKMKKFLPEEDKHRVTEVMRRLLGFAGSAGVRELLPGSAFLASLKEPPCDRMYCLSTGGTDPDIIRLPGIKPLRHVIEKAFPSGMLPDELRDGLGDGLVTARSAVMPGSHEHLDFSVSHLAALFSPEVREAIMTRIMEHCL